MRIGKFVSAGTGLAALTLLVGSAQAQTRVTRTLQFESVNTTSFGSAPFNFAGDGVANYAWFTGKSDMGRITGQGISQSAPTGGQCSLPDGTTGIELKLVDHVAVTRFESTGDLLYERGKPGDLVACLNLQNGTFRESGTVTINGGTGRFKGATGSYTATQDGQIMVPPGSDKLQFGFATATYRYTITIPAQNSNSNSQTEAVIAGPKNITANGRTLQLDGSQSTSADGEALSYRWSAAEDGPAAKIVDADSPTPTVQLPRNGKYLLELTVTDSTGKSAKDFVIVSAGK